MLVSGNVGNPLNNRGFAKTGSVLPIARHRFVRFCDTFLSVCLRVDADTRGDTGKQKPDSKTHYFSLKCGPLKSLRDVVRYYIIMQIRLMCGITHILDMSCMLFKAKI